MRTLDCAELADLAPELALGKLIGDERAAAIAHLERCTSCRHELNSLTTVTDRLLRPAPSHPPVSNSASSPHSPPTSPAGAMTASRAVDGQPPLRASDR